MKIDGAASDMNVNRMTGQLNQVPSLSKRAALTKSDSNLLYRTSPMLPPKSKPLLPAKQVINKSREDVHKINKVIFV